MRGLDVEQPSLRFLGLRTLADWYADWTDVQLHGRFETLQNSWPKPAGALLQGNQPLMSPVCLVDSSQRCSMIYSDLQACPREMGIRRHHDQRASSCIDLEQLSCSALLHAAKA